MKGFGVFTGAVFFFTGTGFFIAIAQSDSPLWLRLIKMLFTVPVAAMGALVVGALMGWLPKELDQKLKSIADASSAKTARSAGSELDAFNQRAAMLDARIGSHGSTVPDASDASRQQGAPLIDSNVAFDGGAHGSDTSSQPDLKEKA